MPAPGLAGGDHAVKLAEHIAATIDLDTSRKPAPVAKAPVRKTKGARR